MAKKNTTFPQSGGKWRKVVFCFYFYAINSKKDCRNCTENMIVNWMPKGG